MSEEDKKAEVPKFDSPIYHHEIVESKDKKVEIYYVMPHSFLKFSKNMIIAWSVVGFIGLVILVLLGWQFYSGHYPSRFLAALEAIARLKI